MANTDSPGDRNVVFQATCTPSQCARPNLPIFKVWRTGGGRDKEARTILLQLGVTSAIAFGALELAVRATQSDPGPVAKVVA